MKVIPTALPGVVVIQPNVFHDDRGSFRTTFHGDEYDALHLEHEFVQDNVSVSRRDVLRGLHFQHPHGQAKLVCAVCGEVFDVAVDVRAGSPTFGRAIWATLSAENQREVLIPAGFAHGFLVTSDDAVVAYKCSTYHAPMSEQTIRWNDPALAIPWPCTTPVQSARDAGAVLLHEIPLDRLPTG